MLQCGLQQAFRHVAAGTSADSVLKLVLNLRNSQA